MNRPRMIAGFAVAASLLAAHAVALRWMASVGAGEALLAPGGADVIWALPVTAAFLLLRLTVLLAVPGLFAATLVWACLP